MIEKKALRVPDYIEHIVEAITRIEAYVSGLDQSAFVANTLVQDAVIRNFEIIGEAANKIQTVDAAFAHLHPDLRLEQAYRMRNALAHGYASVNLRTVWNTIQSDLPILKQQLTAILRASKKDG
jgi:uncharacterized protein with HEPN domain